MGMLEGLIDKFEEYVNNKKWNKIMEDKSKNVFRRLMEIEKEYSKSILDISNEIIVKHIKRMSYQAFMQEIYMVNQVFDFLGSNKRLAISDFSEDMLKVNEDRFYTKDEMQDICESLVNPQDKILLYGLFAGLRGDKYKELLNLKVKDINFECNYIQIEDRIIQIDDYFKKILLDAIDPFYGRVYYKYYNSDSKSQSNTYYLLNMDSEYVIKTKPYTKNDFGLKPMTNSGLQTRLVKLGKVLSRSLVPVDIVRSGIMSRMNELEKSWAENNMTDKFWGKESVVNYLKENKLKAEPYELVRIYKQKYK